MTKMTKRGRPKKKNQTPRQQQTGGASSESIRLGREYLSSRQASLPSPPRLNAKRFEALLQTATASINLDETVQRWVQLWVKAVEESGKSVPGLPHQDHASHELLHGLLRRVESACVRLKINPLSDAVVGTIHADDINAFNASFFGTTSLVVLHHRSLIFVWLLVKCVIPTIACPSNGEVLLGKPSPPEHYEPAVARMRELVLAMRAHRDPARAPVYLLPPDWCFMHLAQRCVSCIELFILAHEYGHLVTERGDENFRTPVAVEPSMLDEEHLADLFAYLIVLRDADSQSPAPWALSPLIFFKFLSLLERGGVVPLPDSHPSGADRLDLLVSMFDQLSSNTDAETGARGLLLVWNGINSLLDDAWILASQDPEATRTAQKPDAPDGAPNLAPLGAALRE